MRIQYNINNNYNQNVQVRQRNLNNSNLESKKLENRTQKYSTNENISFGMGTINPNKSRNIFQNISLDWLKNKTVQIVSDEISGKTRKFSFKNLIKIIKENREISNFKSYLKFENDFPKDKIAEMFTDKNIENIRAKKAFYLTTKHNDSSPKNISKETIVDVMSNVNTRNLNLAISLFTNQNFPKEKISSIIQDSDPISFDFKESFYNLLDKRCKLLNEQHVMKYQIDDIVFVMEQTDKKYLEFVKQLWNDPAFSKSEVLELLHNNKDKTDALQYIYNLAQRKQYDWGTLETPDVIDCSDARMPSYLSRDAIKRTDIIRNLLFYTNKDNVKTAEELCNLTRLDSEIVATALKNA